MAFVWYWSRAQEIYPKWRDGLRSAIDEMGKENQIDIYLGEVEPDEEYDCILFWGDSNCPFFDKLDHHNGKKGIILTTDPHNIDNLKKLDVVFCESQPIYDEVRKHGIRAVKAFGTDTDFFTPDDTIVKDIPYFFPATFSPWKKQSDIAHLGRNLYLVGTVQPDGQEELRACRQRGCNIEEGYFKPEYIRDLYRRAQKVIIPALHGSERTCIEAMATNLLPEVLNAQNRRTRSYLIEYVQSGCKTPRDFIITHYNHIKYAKDILRGFGY